MFKKIGSYAYNIAIHSNPWTNVYGIARTLMALSMGLTLAINPAEILLRPSSMSMDYPNCGKSSISLFCMVPNDYIYLNLLRWISVILLLIIASGWRPRITGFIHWYLAYSLNVSAITLDGGEQVNAVITFLLLPVTLTDNRKWHWETYRCSDPDSEREIIRRIIAKISIYFIRFQIAILYLHSTIAKLYNTEWINGTAVYYYLNDPMLGLPPFLLNLFKPILTTNLVVIPTWGTILLQLCLFGALFAPKNYWKYFLFMAITFHETIALFLGLISFSMMMFASLILYLRPVEKEFSFIKKWAMLFRNNEKSNITQLKGSVSMILKR
ncbi:hypothetical protein B6A27_00480 [Anoxybacillus sp. UARK-01]|uniref:sporulation-delaying protein SdpB family protein n=1 Tax=Anoxybacillus sp. UARK-01 TaxID=1895648 RepID=UPI0009BB8CCF|nr:sporulation-delaying protein SdpB family protein [Anoxybacillus sp. UARK-01]OQM47410.1 hypothetical protein B6A27_00480 [Anoxybacillus sp. UARK-01]